MNGEPRNQHIPLTSASLLNGLVLGESKSQERFHRAYAKLMYEWCRRAGLSHHDAEDMTADLTVKLMWQFEHNCTFDVSRSFRKWLKAVVNNAVRAFWRTNAKLQFKESDRLDELTTEASLTDWVEQNLVLCEAKERAQAICNQRHWQMFRMLTEEGFTAMEVAARFEVARTVVDSAKNRVLNEIKRQVRLLAE